MEYLWYLWWSGPRSCRPLVLLSRLQATQGKLWALCLLSFPVRAADYDAADWLVRGCGLSRAARHQVPDDERRGRPAEEGERERVGGGGSANITRAH